MAYILGIDTCGLGYSIAILKNELLVAQYICDEKHKQCEELSLQVEKILDENNIDYSDIKKIVVTKGPGSFNGIRIGSSFAYGISIALNIPVIMVNTMAVIAYKAKLQDISLKNITVIYQLNDLQCLVENIKLENIIDNPKLVLLQDIDITENDKKFSMQNFDDYNETGISNAYAVSLLSNNICSDNDELIYGKPPSISQTKITLSRD